MEQITRLVSFTILFVFLVYLLLPSPDFPAEPPQSLKSEEPADLETPRRRAYYTDLTRKEALEYYQQEFSKSRFGIRLLSYRLNYPPEEARVVIRDQTQSTFLEEIVHPFRESLYVNGFEPKLDKDAIVVDGKHWRQKLIVRYVPNFAVVRLLVIIPALALFYLALREWRRTLGSFRSDA